MRHSMKPDLRADYKIRLYTGPQNPVLRGVHIVERFFGYLKQFRRVATRYDKHIQNYMGFVYIAAIKIWLK